MRNGGFAVFSFVALAFLGVSLTREPERHAADPGGPMAAQAQASSEAHRPSLACNRALRLIADHWGMALRPSAVSTIETERENSVEIKRKTGTSKTTVTRKATRETDAAQSLNAEDAAAVVARFQATQSRVVLATMPDPIDSDFAVDFDRYLEAIERAASVRSFVPDRHDLPWKPPSDASETAAKTGSTPGRHRWEPGLVLLREEREDVPLEKRRLLLIVIVGETPIGGIQKLAFQQALDLARHLNGDVPPVVVVGPTLSGSVTSLRLVLKEGLKSAPGRAHVMFIATTASRDSNKSDLEGDWPPEASAATSTGLTVSYRSAMHSDSTNFYALERYLADRGYKGRVGLLSESSSAYGLQVPVDVPAGPPASTGGAGAAPLSPSCKETKPGTVTYDCFSFPMRIAQLRAAYEREQVIARPSSHEKGAPTALQLSFGSGGSARELAPMYSTALSANGAELVLINTFDTIRRQKIRYLAIMSTDVRDRLFIAQMARRYLADVQLVSFDSDVLLTHPQVAADAEGLLVISSYPLALGTARGSDHAFRDFPSTGAASTFNAATEALWMLLPTRKRSELAAFVGLEPGRHPGELRPRIWVSVINHLREWPLVGYPAPEDAIGILHGTTAPAAFTTEASGRGHLLFAGAIALLAVGCAFLLVSFPTRGVLYRQSVARALTLGTFRAAPSWLLLSLALLLVFWEIGVTPTGASLAAAAVTCLFGLTMAPPAVRPVSFLTSQNILVVGVAGLIAFVGIKALPSVAPPTLVPLDELRKVVFGSGLDQRVPMALAIGALVLLLLVQPLQASDGDHFSHLNLFREPNATLDLKPQAGNKRKLTFGFDEFHLLIGRELFWKWGARAWTFALVAALGVVLSWWLDAPFTRLRGLDGQIADVTMSVLLTAGVLCVVASGAHAWCIWRRVQQLLSRLAWHPIHAAFDRLPERLAHDLGLKGTLRFTSVSELGFSIEQAAMLSNHLALMRKALPLPLRASTLNELLWLRTVALTDRWTYKFRREIRQSETARSRRAVDSATLIRLLEVSHGVFRLLFKVWHARPLATALIGASATRPWPDAKAEREEHTVHIYRRQVPDDFHVLVRLCEDFAATLTVEYLRFVFVLLKRLVLGVVGATMLLLFAIVSYPFEPSGGLTLFALGLFASLVLLVVLLIVQTERDPILSRIANTEPNRLTLSAPLMMQFGLYVLAPAVVAITTQFPRLRDSVGRLLEPMLKVMQG